MDLEHGLRAGAGPLEAARRAGVAVARPFVALARFTATVVGAARDAVARGMLAIGLTPNTVTLVGPVVAAPVAWAWALGHQRLGGVLLIAASSFDLLDGTVARIGGQVTRFGAFFDSVVDRYSDFVMFAGIYLYLVRHTEGTDRVVWMAVWVLALLGGLLPSYIRARAESLIPLCKVGFLERAERVVTIFVGAIGSNLHLSILVIAVFGNWMSIERILYTREQLEPESRRWGRLLWRHERLTPAHAVMCCTLIAFLLFGHWLVPRP